MGGGLTGVFRNQRTIRFCFIHFLHSEVAWEAQSSILSVKLDMNIRGLCPRGLRPKKALHNASRKGVDLCQRGAAGNTRHTILNGGARGPQPSKLLRL